MKTLTRSIRSYLLLIALSMAYMATAQAQVVEVNSADPNSAEQGTIDLDVVIMGSGFDSTATVDFFNTGTVNPGGVTVKKVKVRGRKKIIATITVADDADVVEKDIVVSLSSGRGGKGTTLFSVKKNSAKEDTTPPSPIADLHTKHHDSTAMILVWTAPGDDFDVGTVDHYTAQMASQGTTCVAPYDFSNSVDLTPPWPVEAGLGQELQVLGLDSETCYAFEVKPFDEAGNSAVASVTFGTTNPPLLSWSVPELVAGTESGWHQEHAYDKDGNAVFLLSNSGGGTTKYAKRRAIDDWVVEDVIKTRGEGNLDLVINSVTGNPMGVATGPRRNLQFLERTDEGWQTTFVYRRPSSWHENSLNQDQFGSPLVAFMADDLTLLARRDPSSGSFSTELVSSIRGLRPALDMHPVTDLPAVVFYESFNFLEGQLHYAAYDGTGWSDETIDSGRMSSLFSFAFAPNGEPVVIYAGGNSEGSTTVIKIAHRDAGGTWSSVAFDPDGAEHQKYPSMVYRSDGTLFVVWVDSDDTRVGRLCESGHGYACESVWAVKDEWVIETANDDANGNLGQGAAIALDPNGPDGGTPSIGVTKDGLLYSFCKPGESAICTPDFTP